jgi:hypothetical protein
MARRVKGAARIQTILRGLPDAYRKEMVSALEAGGEALAPEMKARAPRRTGATQAGISYKVTPRSLRLKVGLLGLRSGQGDLFYSRIQDLGRKAKTVKVRRRGTRPYMMRVRAMAGKRFVTGQFTDLRAVITAKVRGIFGRALNRLSGGSD